MSQVYPSLKRLHEAGWVTYAEVQREGKPDLKLYRITEKGMAASREWLTSPFQFVGTRENADRFMLRLALMGCLEPDELITYLDAGIEALSKGRAIHMESDLEQKLAFIDDATPGALERYREIWQHESAYIMAEYDLQLGYLKKLRKSLQ